MSINNIIPEQNEILKDELSLWYFTKEQKNKIIDYLKDCSLEDLKDVSAMSDTYYIPTWYYFLNDYDISKQLTENDNFKELLELTEQDYIMPSQNDITLFTPFKKIVTHLDTTVYFTPNNEVLLLLKKAGFVFKDNSFSTDNYYRTYEIIKDGIVDFNEEYLIKNIYNVRDQYTSLLQKILFDYENKKNNKNDLLQMAKTINGFVELGCETEIQYKKLVSASEYFISEKKHYREVIKQCCPELNIFMEKLDFIKRMENFSGKKQTRSKI